DGPPQEWVATGVTQCVDNLIVAQEVNQCGLLRWVETTNDCVDGLLDCDGNPHQTGNQVPTCEQMQDAIDESGITIDPVAGTCLTGDGSEENPLGLDLECLGDELETEIVTANTDTVNLSGEGTAAG